MARKIITDKKAVGSTPSSTPEDGYKAKKAPTRKVSSKKAGIKDLSSISIHEKVALLAYSYWEDRGRQEGSPEEDWYRAEREVLSGVIQKNS